MEGHILRRAAYGVGLWELSLGVALVALLAGVIVLSSRQITHNARNERTFRDMAAILEACRQYDALYGGWPPSLSALHDLLPRIPAENIWGYPFMIGSGPQRCWVDTDLPGKGRVHLSTPRMHGAAARLVYEKRNVYVP